ncbi:BnaC06g40520D [Brassica napus]|uniref:BnaC06g40520D protein n=2 Tax=Brassica napus TaxID=3708 RepID=A0A078HRS0_BRANA|nr:BnaC06g40520D [Brassica napus]
MRGRNRRMVSEDPKQQ